MPPASVAGAHGVHAAPGARGASYRGTLPPGTKVVVGAHVVSVVRFLAEGGFAHVYLVTARQPIPVPDIDSRRRKFMRPTTTLVLKRMAVPDKPTLAHVRAEVETHRLLRGHTHVVHFIEASATALPTGGYEIFILMEYCSGGGIIDLMNAHLRDRLKEDQVLHIFADVCQGLAVMHHLDPPLLHRDLKIENVLISPPPPDDPSRGAIYKLADFGSAAPLLSRHAPKSLEEIKKVEEDLNRATTLQYRAPEMVDLYQRRVIDEKADIWAMGVFLYKLCYFITPFEENGGGSLAILNARYRFPPSPPYSSKLKALIASMLKERAEDRPTVDQLIVRAFELRGLHPPSLAKQYVQLTLEGKQMPSIPAVASQPRPQRTPEPPKGEPSPRPPQPSAKPRVIQVGSDAVRDEDLAALRNSVQPMRRGRPAKSSSHTSNGVHDDPSPALKTISPGMEKGRPYPTSDGFGDSFVPSPPAAIAPNPPTPSVVPTSFFDDATARFPSLEELDATSSTPGNDTPSKTATPVLGKSHQASTSPALLPSRPTHTRIGSIKDRWPPLREEDAAKVAKVRSQLAAEPVGEAPALPHRNGASFPISPASSSPRVSHASARGAVPNPKPQAMPQSRLQTTTGPETEAPAQDWLTGSEDLLVDTIPSPITADSTKRARYPPQEGADESSDDEAQPEAAEGNPYARKEVGKISLPAWVETPTSPPFRSTAEKLGSGEDKPAPGRKREYSFEVDMQPEDEIDLALIEGRIPSDAVPSLTASAVSPPPIISPAAQPEDEMDLALIEGRVPSQQGTSPSTFTGPIPTIASPAAQLEDEMDLALIEGRLPSVAVTSRSASTVPATSPAPGAVQPPERADPLTEGVDYGANPPIKAPSWDEDLPSPPSKPTAGSVREPTPSPRAFSPAPAPNNPPENVDSIGKLPGSLTGNGATRPSPSLSSEAQRGHQTSTIDSSHATGAPPTTKSPPLSKTRIISPTHSPSSSSASPLPGMPSLQDRMRDLELAKATVAAKSEPPSTAGKRHARPASQSISLSTGLSPKPGPKPGLALPSRSSTLNTKPAGWKGPSAGGGGSRPPPPAKLKPWEREALAAEAIQHGGVVRSDMRLLDGPEPEQRTTRESEPDLESTGFKGVNRLISQWQQIGR